MNPVAVVLGIFTVLGGIAAIPYLIEWFRKRKKRNERPEAKQVSLRNEAEIEQAILSSANSDWRHEFRQANSTTVYKPDVNLRFEINYEGDGVQHEHFEEEWANRYPDPKATGYYCDLYYGSSRIRQFILVSVDGGRSMLPLPKSRTDLRVSALDYKVAEIHDDNGKMSEYFRRAGFAVEPDDEGGPKEPECPENRMVREILAWKGKAITLSQMRAERASILGSVRGQAEVILADCTESYATIIAGGSSRSIPLRRLDVSYDNGKHRLELQERPS